MASHKRVDEPEVTARPKDPMSELSPEPIAEEGLPIAPEDLGRQFLSRATEQGNFESQQGGDTSELSIVEGPPTDDPLTGPNFDPDHSVWDQTVDLTLQEGGEAEARDRMSAGGSEQTQGIPDEPEEVDLTEAGIREASLLDRESDELGEVEEPSPRTDDTEQGAMRRGKRRSLRI